MGLAMEFTTCIGELCEKNVLGGGEQSLVGNRLHAAQF